MSDLNLPHDSAAEVDFRRRETEAGWQGVVDRFALAAAPTWFQWLEWILILGAIEYLAIKSGAGVARWISSISLALLWFYFNAFFFRLQFKGLFGIRSVAIERVLSLVVSSALAIIFWLVAQATAHAIAAYTK